MVHGRVRVFIASSVDGFIAGEGDDLGWLPGADPSGDDHGYAAFMGQIGCLLMGRRTYEVVACFDGPWPYGDTPVLVATQRPLQPKVASVRAVAGPIDAVLDAALAEAAGRDVYLDGGQLIRAALDAGRIDELIVTTIPVVLGRGVPLFAGCARRHPLRLVANRTTAGGLVQSTLVPVGR